MEKVLREGYGTIPRGAKAIKTKVLSKEDGVFLGHLVTVSSLAEKSSPPKEVGIFCIVREMNGNTGQFNIEKVDLVPDI